MPYLYTEVYSAPGGVGDTAEYILPTFHIDTDTMEQIATQSNTDPLTFKVNDNGELLMEA